MIPTGPVLVAVLVVAMTYLIGEEAVKGAKWIGHKAKNGGTVIVHVLKKVF